METVNLERMVKSPNHTEEYHIKMDENTKCVVETKDRTFTFKGDDFKIQNKNGFYEPELSKVKTQMKAGFKISKVYLSDPERDIIDYFLSKLDELEIKVDGEDTPFMIDDLLNIPEHEITIEMKGVLTAKEYGIKDVRFRCCLDNNEIDWNIEEYVLEDEIRKIIYA